LCCVLKNGCWWVARRSLFGLSTYLIFHPWSGPAAGSSRLSRAPICCQCDAYAMLQYSSLLVSARLCSSLLVPARPCSSLLVPARPCSSLLVPARPCSSLLVPARLYQPNPTPIRETCIDALVPVPPYFFTMRCHTALGNTFSAVSCSTFLSAARG
jgi:hypothetical protein